MNNGNAIFSRDISYVGSLKDGDLVNGAKFERRLDPDYQFRCGVGNRVNLYVYASIAYDASMPEFGINVSWDFDHTIRTVEGLDVFFLFPYWDWQESNVEYSDASGNTFVKSGLLNYNYFQIPNKAGNPFPHAGRLGFIRYNRVIPVRAAGDFMNVWFYTEDSFDFDGTISVWAISGHDAVGGENLNAR